MQTFLPFPDFALSAECLDRQRLGKQRVEAWQILRVLLGHSTGWRRHPAVLMWSGSESALRAYGVAICEQWRSRGYKDTMLERFEAGENWITPSWLGDPAFHSAHRAALLAKNPTWYGRYGWNETPKIDYVWPSGGEQ